MRGYKGVSPRGAAIAWGRPAGACHRETEEGESIREKERARVREEVEEMACGLGAVHDCHRDKDLLQNIDAHVKSYSAIKKLLQRLRAKRKASKLQRKLEKFQELAKQGSQILDTFKKHMEKNMHSAPNPTTTISRPYCTKVIGRDEDHSDIKKMLDEACSHSVIGIYGIAGSGKTTLAQYVCKYEEKQSKFSHVIWIDVSRRFDLDEIYREMLEAVSGSARPISNPEILRKKLDRQLRGKRFLMVLDGMRTAVDEDKKNELLARLNTGGKKSKILVTTWSRDAAMSLGAESPIKIHGLKAEDFMHLLMHYALGDGKKFDKQKLKEVAERLGRSPFAAKEVGGLLRTSPSLDLNLNAPIRALCPGIISDLLQSYKHLDEPVRRCFAYCSLFPRMYRFKRDALIKLWMAQGFIETDLVKKMQDIGEEYFNKLVSWSFLQGTPNGVWFTIPDMLHELAEEVSGTDCLRVQQGYEVIAKMNEMKASPSRVRHLCITSSNAMRFKSDICKMKKLRTIIITADGLGITAQVFKSMLQKLRKLRVVQVYLDVHKLRTPESVCDLKHLRFLSFSGPNLRTVELPKKFGKLYHLQTIECPPSCYLNCSKVKRWNNLINLRHMPHVGDKLWQESSHSKVH